MSRWENLKALARPATRVAMRGLLRGSVPGGLVVLLFSVAVLMASIRVSDRNYASRLTVADSSSYMVGPALVVSGKDDFTLRTLLRDPAPLKSTDKGTSVYVLQTFVAWYLRNFLPLRPAMAVLLNGVWFTAMGLSVYALLWSRLRRWPTAALATAAFLVANPFVPTVLFGLTSLDPNLVGFTLGTCVMCWVLLSDGFQRLVPCALAGFFLGALVLGRVYTLGVVLPALLPYFIASFWGRSREDIVRSLTGLVVAGAAVYVVCGWWVIRYWREALAYPTLFGSMGTIERTSFTAGLSQWLLFPRSGFVRGFVLLAVLSWPFAVSLLVSKPALRRFNWLALWLAVCPLLVLAKMGTTFQPYGAISLLGVFLLLLFPFKPAWPELVTTGRYAAALALACALNVWAFFGALHLYHSPTGNNKRGTITALESMREHATKAGRKRVKLGLVHWGALHDASLTNALVFDLGVRVATGSYQPSQKSQTNAFIVEPLTVDPWAWEPRVSGNASVTPAAWAEHLIQEADYVLVLSGTRGQDRRKGRWPPWVEASDLLRMSGTFERLGAPFRIPNDGNVELLVRKKPARR